MIELSALPVMYTSVPLSATAKLAAPLAFMTTLSTTGTGESPTSSSSRSKGTASKLPAEPYTMWPDGT